MNDLASRYQQVLAQIAAAHQAAGVGARAVRLLPVSKTHPAEMIRALYALGLREFGENYAQEMATKAAALADLVDLRLVFIGRLQSNKIALIVRTAAAVQSLGDERHARLLAKQAALAGKTPYPVHILVNAGDEASKDGVALDGVPAFARTLLAMPELRLRGIMAIPPPLPAIADAKSKIPEIYLQLRRLADAVGEGDLSLGMSNDLGPAIAAGSDCVRIGTAIFGARP